MNIEALAEWQSSARRGLEHEIEALQDRERQMCDFLKALECLDKLQAEVVRLTDELEQRQSEIDALDRELSAKQAVIDDLRRQLVDEKEHRVTQQQSKAQETAALPAEIHNHFEAGSSAQVFNSKVTGKFKDRKKWKRIVKQNK